jgi:hypothetical protein
MGRTCCLKWEIKNSYFLVGKPPENTVRGHRRGLEDNIKMALK